MSDPFSFAPVASTQITGFMQAVSADGKITIYGTHEKYYVYYYQNEKIISNTFTIPYYITDVKQKYNEEGQPFYKVHTKLMGDVIKVYLISANRHFVARVELEEKGGGEVNIVQEEFSWEVLDMAIHPSHDSLLVLSHNSVWVAFQPAAQHYRVQLEVGSASMTSGKLLVVQQGDGWYYYVFYIQYNSASSEQLRIHKLQQVSIGQDYSSVGQKFIPLQPSSNQFSKIQFHTSSQIFAVSCQYSQNGTRDKSTFYINTKLTWLRTSGRTNASSFAGFVDGENRMILGNYYFPEEFCQLYQICITTFSVQSEQIIFEDGECEKGFYDRVGVFQMGNSTYYLTQIDQTLTIHNESLSTDLATLDTYTFSTRHQDMLIVSKCSTLQYLSQKQTQNIPQQPTTQVGMVVGLCVFCLAFSILLLFFLIKCSQKKSKKQQNSEVKIDNQETNPYLNPYVQNEIQTPKKEKLSRNKKRRKGSEPDISKSMEVIKKE